MLKAPAALLLAIIILAVGSYWFRENIVVRSVLTVALVMVLAAGAWGVLG